MSMKLDAKKGDMIRFAHPTAGLKCHSDLAYKYLRPMVQYTVERMDVGDFNSKVYIQEVTDTGFNTVLFDDVVDICSNCGGNGEDPDNNINKFLKCSVCKGEGTLKGSSEYDKVKVGNSFLDMWENIWEDFDELCNERNIPGLEEEDIAELQQLIERSWPKVIYACVDDVDCETKFGTYSKEVAVAWDKSAEEKWYYEVEIK